MLVPANSLPSYREGEVLFDGEGPEQKRTVVRFCSVCSRYLDDLAEFHCFNVATEKPQSVTNCLCSELFVLFGLVIAAVPN
jgi:hypothetical protein